MTNQEYRNSLTSATVNTLRNKYEEVFMVRPPSKYRKDELINKLVEKFADLNKDNPEAEVVEEVQEEPTEVKPVNGSRNGSRRGTIIMLVTQNIWDTDTLAEWLQLVNPEWPVKKNKSAISGTLADMKKNHGWVVDKDDKGRIVVGNC